MIVTIAGTPFEVRPTDDQLGAISIVTAAFDGEVGNGTFPVPDPDNVLTAVTGRQFMVEEGSTVLSDGFMLDQDRTRGTEPQGRDYGFGIQDANALLDGFRIARSRPSELDYDRVLAFAAADGPSWDTTWVLETEGVTMPAKKYYSDGGWTSELIPDVVAFTGKTLFLHDKAAGGRCLHYHNLVSGHGCGLSISDDSADVDHVTVWEPWEPVRQRTSVDLRNSIKGVDQAGRTSIQFDAGSIAAHDADGLQHQAQPQLETNSQADLDVQTAAMLASIKGDLDTWTCQIGPLGEDALALIRVGDIITVTSAVMGLSDHDQRISHLTLTPAIGQAGTAVPDVWMATLEMGAPIRRRRRKRPKSFVDRVEHTPIPQACEYTSSLIDDFDRTEALAWGQSSDPDISWVKSTGLGFDLSIHTVDPSTGGTIQTVPSGIGSLGAEYAQIPRERFVLGDDCPVDMIRLTFDIIVDNQPSSAPSYAHQWFVGLVDDDGSPDPLDFPPYFWLRYVKTDTGSGNGLFLNAWLSGGLEGWYIGPVLDNGGPYHIVIERWSARKVFIVYIDTDSYEFDASAFTFDVIDGVVTMLSYSVSDDSGDGYIAHSIDQPYISAESTITFAHHWTEFGPVAPQETPDGIITDFTNPPYPSGGYVPGSLHVFVDGQSQNVEELSPAAGTWRLSWAPEADNEVKASWIVP